jgi:hypothetical protein
MSHLVARATRPVLNELAVPPREEETLTDVRFTERSRFNIAYRYA